MQNIDVTWILPTTRESGLPLNPADILGVDIELSADGGDNFASFGVFDPEPALATITDLEPGLWVIRGTVVDRKDRRSKPKVISITLEDTSAPGALVSLDLSAA